MQKVNWNYPTEMWIGENRIKDLGTACKKLGIKKPLLVTDCELVKKNIVKDSILGLNKEGFSVELFSNVVGNPTGDNVSKGVEFFKKRNCNGVIAFGGGSGLDVGACGVRLAEVQARKGSFTLSRYHSVPVEAGEDAWDVVAEAFSTLRQRPSPVRVGVGGADAMLRYLPVPQVEDWRLERLMDFEVRCQLNLRVDKKAGGPRARRKP